MRKLILLLLLLWGLRSPAQVINAASCSSTDVQAAFNSVVASTTTVNIPTCTGTWTTTVTLTQPSSSTTLTIHGNSTISGTCTTGGSCTATDNTVIVDNLTRGGGGCGTDPSMLSITTGSATSKFEMTGITFQFTGQQTCGGSIRISGNSQLLRIDHNHFAQQYSTGIGMGGWTYGVIDHNLFEATTLGTWNGIKFQEDGFNNDSLGVGDQSWAANTNFGTSGAVYVENNYFNSTSSGPNYYANDCTSGGRYVWRYNLMNNVELQTHPTGGGQRHRGCRSTEIYNNTATGSGGVGSDFNFFFLSSGPSLIWGNTVPNNYSNFITIHSMRRDNSTYGQAATPNGWGYCGTSFNGTGSAWDQNNNASTGYRCLDQPGQGVGQLLVNDFPNTKNNVTGTIAWPNEAFEPVYEWINTSSAATFLANYETDALFQNSDYYLYTGSFTGASGTGSGLLSARPATCTVKVAYWATDTSTLYTCNTTNTWTAYYTPFTYPHPLINGSSQAATPTFSPAAGSYLTPQNVAITSATGATICYTNDGTTPTANGAGTCTHGTTLTNGGTVTVGFTQLLQAIASASGLTDSLVGSAQYTFPTATSGTMFAGTMTSQGTAVVQ